MQKNWYIIYTKPKCERKVALALSKKKIANYYPLNTKQVKEGKRRKLVYEPLFASYVFANIPAHHIPFLRRIDGFVNLVYWKGQPAEVKPEEIEAIREFTTDHFNIRLEKSHVNAIYDVNGAEGRSYTVGEKILMIKNRSFNLALPSIGFTLIAELEVEAVRGIDITFGNRELSLQ